MNPRNASCWCCTRIITGSECYIVRSFRIHSLKFTMKGKTVVFTCPPSCTAQSSLFLCSCIRGVPGHPGNCISCALDVRDFLLEGVSQWTPCPNGPQSPLFVGRNTHFAKYDKHFYFFRKKDRSIKLPQFREIFFTIPGDLRRSRAISGDSRKFRETWQVWYPQQIIK